MRSIVILLASLPVLNGQAPSLATRVAEAEAVVARHYRGEPLEAARTKVMADIAAYNADMAAAKTVLEAAKAALDAKLEPLRAMEARLGEMDKRLADLPMTNDAPAEARHAALLKERKALADTHNAQREAVQPEVEAYNAQMKRSNEALSARRAAVTEAQKQVNARIDAYETFQKNGGDAAFYGGLTRLLGDCLKASDASAAARVRTLRKEIIRWAMARAAAQPFGPVLVEALVEGEPCCLMLETGAMRTSLSPELAAVLGLNNRLGEEASFALPGGARLQGRAVELPSVTVSGATAASVPAVVAAAPGAGIDGLLGQSFLKGFIYTVDERKPEKLLLQARKP